MPGAVAPGSALTARPSAGLRRRSISTRGHARSVTGVSRCLCYEARQASLHCFAQFHGFMTILAYFSKTFSGAETIANTISTMTEILIIMIFIKANLHILI